ncbi:MAG: hypothetical protein C0175_00525 [Caldisericum exile]|uniref:Uncharacterized protein n=1 Tax=Caldisericum exile TaxID=693075 RepID=A0A2J6X9N9_9BACT|nr:MAG: hypothetical protein C0175_00525 [Caldisericum exile]
MNNLLNLENLDDYELLELKNLHQKNLKTHPSWLTLLLIDYYLDSKTEISDDLETQIFISRVFDNNIDQLKTLDFDYRTDSFNSLLTESIENEKSRRFKENLENKLTEKENQPKEKKNKI